MVVSCVLDRIGQKQNKVAKQQEIKAWPMKKICQVTSEAHNTDLQFATTYLPHVSNSAFEVSWFIAVFCCCCCSSVTMKIFWKWYNSHIITWNKTKQQQQTKLQTHKQETEHQVHRKELTQEELYQKIGPWDTASVNSMMGP